MLRRRPYLLLFLTILTNSTSSTLSKYGRLFLPRDVYYDEEVREALPILRDFGKQLQDASGDGDDKHNHNHDRNQNSKNSDADEDDGIGIYNRALSSLKSSGNQDTVTLTLIGYKGGKLEEQINQDRAFVLWPFQFLNGENGEDGGKMEQSDDESMVDDRDNLEEPVQLLGVFDGHGEKGEIVSQYAVDEIPKFISSELRGDAFRDGETSERETELIEDGLRRFLPKDEEMHAVLSKTFLHVNQTIPTLGEGGCTASVLLRIGNKIHIANVGDSRVFVATYTPSTGKVEIVYSSREDKPSLPEERIRVEKMGGRVYIPKSADDSSRVVRIDYKTGTQSSLAMSRSLGDWYFSPVGVISKPIVETINIRTIVEDAIKKVSSQNNASCSSDAREGAIDRDLSETCVYNDNLDGDEFHLFAVAATDGLLDFVEPIEIVTTFAKAFYQKDIEKIDDAGDSMDRQKYISLHPLTACEQLIMKAAEGWYQEEGYNYRDDIAVAAMKLPIHN